MRIAFLGYLDPSRGADALLELCRREGDGVELVVAGYCRSPELLERFTSTRGVRMLGLLPYEQALGWMRRSDLVAATCDPAVPAFRLISAPTKFFEAMMTGTPVLVNAEAPCARLVLEHGLGEAVPYGDVEGMRRAVARYRDPEFLGQARQRCRQYYLEHCRLNRELEGYRAFYGTVLKKAGFCR